MPGGGPAAGYVWDYLGATETPKRFAAITKDDGPERKLWLEYSKKVYETAAAHENFWGGFITWEDFWNYTENMGRDMAMVQPDPYGKGLRLPGVPGGKLHSGPVKGILRPEAGDV